MPLTLPDEALPKFSVATLDRTNPAHMCKWIHEVSRDWTLMREINEASRSQRAATPAQLEPFVSLDLGSALWAAASRTTPLGRPTKLQVRYWAGWCLAAGWDPRDDSIAEAIGDVLIWHVLLEIEIPHPERLRNTGFRVARERRAASGGIWHFEDHSEYREEMYERRDFIDDEGASWRIWYDSFGSADIKLLHPSPQRCRT